MTTFLTGKCLLLHKNAIINHIQCALLKPTMRRLSLLRITRVRGETEDECNNNDNLRVQ